MKGQYTSEKSNRRVAKMISPPNIPSVVRNPPTIALIVILMTIRFTAHAFYIDERQSPHSSSWDYEKQKYWRNEFKTCAERAQSPIDIQSRLVITNTQLMLHFYNYDQSTRFKLQNAHHTIKMEPIGPAYETDRLGGNSSTASTSASDVLATADEYVDPIWRANMAEQGQHSQQYRQLVQHEQVTSNDNSSETTRQRNSSYASNGLDSNNNKRQKGRPTNTATNNHNFVNNNDDDADDSRHKLPYDGAPTIKLDWLDDGNNEYKLRDVHFHWAERRDNGSEHAIDGRRAAMEMHLVHIKHGLDKSKIGITSDSVAVVAVLIESYRKSNADFNPIVNALTSINMTDESQEIEYKSIYDLLPSTLNTFWTYSGSLTTPPCYQVVNWIVMSDRLYMNSKQIEMFRNLYAPQESESSHQMNHAISSNHLSSNNNRYHPQMDHDDIIRDDDSSSSSSSSSTQVSSDRAVSIMPNVRHLQPLNSRTIMASFPPAGRLSPMVGSSSYSNANSLNTCCVKMTGIGSFILFVITLFIASVSKNYHTIIP